MQPLQPAGPLLPGDATGLGAAQLTHPAEGAAADAAAVASEAGRRVVKRATHCRCCWIYKTGRGGTMSVEVHGIPGYFAWKGNKTVIATQTAYQAVEK